MLLSSEARNSLGESSKSFLWVVKDRFGDRSGSCVRGSFDVVGVSGTGSRVVLAEGRSEARRYGVLVLVSIAEGRRLLPLGVVKAEGGPAGEDNPTDGADWRWVARAMRDWFGSARGSLPIAWYFLP